MDSNDEADISNPPCPTTGLQVDSTTDYCARWLATVSAAQHDETSRLVQRHPLSASGPEDSFSDKSHSSSAVGASPCRVTHHRIETPALRQATPNSAPSHIDGDSQPEKNCPSSIPCEESLTPRADRRSKYERQPRRKTRPDRYDTHHQHRDPTTLSRRERRELQRKKLRSRREVMTNFYSSATENRQVLMKPALATGAFVNGRGSVSTPLTDLTFNELTFPILQKPAPRPASPQLPNGARKRPHTHIETPSERVDNHSKRVLPGSDGGPGIPTPQPRQERGARLKQPEQGDNEDGPVTPTKQDGHPRNTTPRPIIQYVDSGVDTMSHAGRLELGDLADASHAQLPSAEYQSREQTYFYAPYYAPLPAYIPQHYGPSHAVNGFYPQSGLQPSLGWAESVPLACPSQHVNSLSMQAGWFNYENQRRDYGYMEPQFDVYSAPIADLDGYGSISPEPEPEPEPEPLYKPDEETKAFWRPNFLR